MPKRQLDTSEDVLTVNSKLNRPMNPVRLSPELYADVFDSSFQQAKNANCEDFSEVQQIIRFILIGKEAGVGVFQLFKYLRTLILSPDFIYLENAERSIKLNYCKFSENLVQLITPYVTSVHFKVSQSEISEEFHQLFFKALIKDQKQQKLTIIHLNTANSFVIEALKKLNQKNIPVKLLHPKPEVLLQLPSVHFDFLECSWFDFLNFLASNSFPCTFNTLEIAKSSWISSKNLGQDVIPHFKELIVVWDFSSKDDLFGQLSKSFPNVQKLTVTYVSSLQELFTREAWNKRKESVENAPQQEIIVKLTFVAYTQEDYEKAIACFDGERVDENNSRWISPTNNLKIINFHVSRTLKCEVSDGVMKFKISIFD